MNARLAKQAAAQESPASSGSGARILFFSGGTALRAASRALADLTHDSIHLITPFDSGGSSAAIRDAFGMLAIGDIRNRLLSLARDPGDATVRILSHRLDDAGPPSAQQLRLDTLARGSDPLTRVLPDHARRIVTSRLQLFRQRMPSSLDLRGAAVGNLVLAAAYLDLGRDLDAAVAEFSQMVDARGTVTAVVDSDLHLCAELSNGRRVVGQHRLTGKQAPPLESPIRDFYLISGLSSPQRVQVEIREQVKRLIASAELICYPPGSFYTSLVANLLPTGVASAIRASPARKVYVPNQLGDPEQIGMSTGESALRLLQYLRRDAGEDAAAEELIDTILIDRKKAVYTEPPALDSPALAGVRVVDTSLAAPSGLRLEGGKLAGALHALARPA